MLAREMQENFLIELNKLDNIREKDKVVKSRDIFFWLNEAVSKFIKIRYSEDLIDPDSYEETQKRIDDLRKLVRDTTLYAGLTITNITNANPGVVTVSSLGDLENDDTVLVKNVSGMTEVNDTEFTVANINIGTNTFELSGVDTLTYTAYTSGGYAYRLFDRDNSYKVDLPSNYWFATREQVKYDYTPLGGSSFSNKTKGVTKVKDDRYEYAVQNPYSEHVLHYDDAKPLRLFLSNNIEITTDGNYYPREYLLKYIKQPAKIILSESEISAGTNTLIIGASYVVDAGDNITHEGTTYSAGDEFIATSNIFTTVGSGTVSTFGNCDLADHTHNEIVKIASALYLESVSDPQLKTKEAEINKME